MAGVRRRARSAQAAARRTVGLLLPALLLAALPPAAPARALSATPAGSVPTARAATAATAALPVRTVDYDLGDAVEPLVGIPDGRGELKGRLYLPAGAATASPVVVFLHGQHTVCVVEEDGWPCPVGGAIPSYLGYAEPAEALARQGIAVVSVSANAINAYDGGASDNGARARGQLVLDTLDLLAAATSPAGSPGFPADLRGTLDLTRVGLMGHSRGGEGVVRAVQLNTQRAEPYPIEAVMPLAPAPFLGLSMPGVITAVVLGYCDSDTGQQIVDASRYAFDDSVLRSTVLLMGANHNFFNSVWSPGGYPVGGFDDGTSFDDDPANAPVCGTGAATRLSQYQQRAVQTGYLLALFRSTLLGERQFLPMIDGTPTDPADLPDPFDGTDPAALAALAAADVRVTAHAPRDDRIDLARLTDPATVPTTDGLGGLTATICAGTTGAVQTAAPLCSSAGGDQLPHWFPIPIAQSVPLAPMARLSWTAPGGTVDVPVDGGPRDVSAMDTLDLALAPGDTVVGSTDVRIDVVDTAGRAATVDPALLAPALTVLPGAAPLLRKVLLRGVRVPLASLIGIDLGAVAGIRVLPQSAPGGLYLSDVAATRSSAGTPAVAALPVLSVWPTAVQQTGEPGVTRVAVVLDRAAPGPVRAWTQSTLQVSQGVEENYDLVRRIEIPAGARCVAVDLPLPAGGGPGGDVASLSTAMTLLTGAVPDTLVAATTVRPDGPSDLPDVGTQGDVCAEALAGPAVLTVNADPAAGTATVSADGYRAKETVTLSGLPGGSSPATITDVTGLASVTVDLAGLAAGTYPLAAAGAGSGRRALGDLVVTGPVPSSTAPTVSTSVITATTEPITTTGTTGTDPATSVVTSTVSSPIPAPAVVTRRTTAGGSPSGGGTARPAGTLAATGMDPAGPLTAAALALIAGTVLVGLGRRRRAHRREPLRRAAFRR